MKLAFAFLSVITITSGCAVPQKRLGDQPSPAIVATESITLPTFPRTNSFGSYDEVFIKTVEQRWYDLLDSISYKSFRGGKVILRFHLKSDGQIKNVTVTENTTSELMSLLCQKAILDPAPYDPWSNEMREEIQKKDRNRDYREIEFTFLYLPKETKPRQAQHRIGKSKKY